jgi:GT2 family glycosyltransferase
MKNSPLTFCIGCSNNLNYLKLAVHSVRTYSHFKDAPFIVFAENCNKDETYKWLQENKDKYNLTIFTEDNSEDTTKGIGGGMNFCAEKVLTEFIMFLHADFFVSTDWDLEALKIFKKYPNIPMWVSSYRIQPNVFKENSRPDTLIVPNDTFGEFYHNFNESYFIEYANEFKKLNDIEIRIGQGVSGLIRKKDWDFIGGNDPIFNPLSFDDLDLFIRMQLKDYKFVLTTKSIVYHFGSRSANGHFPEETVNEQSKKQMYYEQRNRKRFIQKWGQIDIRDEVGFVIPPKRNIL